MVSGYAWLGLANLLARGRGRIGVAPMHLMIPLSAGRTLLRMPLPTHGVRGTFLLTIETDEDQLAISVLGGVPGGRLSRH